MSTVITYERRIRELQPLDGEITFERPIDIQRTHKRWVRLVQCAFTSNLPNVYQIGRDPKLPVDEHNPPVFNNGLIQMTRDGGDTWHNIQLPNGTYNISYINAAIQNATAAWWEDSSLPGFSMSYNLATSEVYFSLDSRFLIEGDQLGIRFDKTNCDDTRSSGLLLGFMDPSIFLEDGLYTANAQAKLDWFGNGVSLRVDGLGAISLVNGKKSSELCRIPLSTSDVKNEYIFPSGVSGTTNSPKILLESMPSILQKLNFEFRGDREEADGTQRVVYGQDGYVSVTLELSWH